MTVELTYTTDLDYLIPQLRIHLWDIEDTPIHSDGTLKLALLAGLKMLMPRWNSRYIPSFNATTENWDVSRNPSDVFTHASPPAIMYGDERPMILAAAIILNSGRLFIIGGDAVSWRDEEISFSNLTGAQLQQASVLRDWEELNKLVPERRQRLARTKRQELPGFRYPPNVYEGES